MLSYAAFLSLFTGMLLLLFLQCADVLLQTNNRQAKRRWRLFTYISIIFCLATIALGTELKWTEMMFIDDRNFPGGPATFGVTMFSYWIPMLCSACGVTLCWLADGFLVSYFPPQLRYRVLLKFME